MNSAERQAIFDYALTDERGLEHFTSLPEATEMLGLIAGQLEPFELFVRVRSSAFPNELLELLIGVLTTKIEARPDMLKPIAEALLEDNNEFRVSSIESFFDHYWSVCVRSRLLRKDYRRAFDEVKRANLGLQGNHYSRISGSLMHTLIEEIYDYMHSQGHLDAVADEPMRLFDQRYERHKLVSNLAGFQLAQVVGGVDWKEEEISRTWRTTMMDIPYANKIGQMIIAIAGRLNSERKEKKAHRIARNLI